MTRQRQFRDTPHPCSGLAPRRHRTAADMSPICCRGAAKLPRKRSTAPLSRIRLCGCGGKAEHDPSVRVATGRSRRIRQSRRRPCAAGADGPRPCGRHGGCRRGARRHRRHRWPHAYRGGAARHRNAEDPARRQPAQSNPDAARRAVRHRRPVGEQRTERPDLHPWLRRQPARLYDGRHSARRPELRQLQRPVAAARGDFGKRRPRRRRDRRGRSGHRVEQQFGRHGRNLFVQPAADARHSGRADRRQLRHVAHLRADRHRHLRRRHQQRLCVGRPPAGPRLGLQRHSGRLAGERQVRPR